MRCLAVAGWLVCGCGLLAAAPARSAPPAQQMVFGADSLPGWSPTVDQQRRALHAANQFFSATDSSRYAEAYSLLSEEAREDTSLAAFTEAIRGFNILSGRPKDRHIVRLTWTKNPNADAGVHAKVDIAGQFANIDRFCGALELYQPFPDADFLIVRREDSYMDNATAHKTEQDRSAADLEQAWKQQSRHCPPDPAGAAGSPG